MAVSAMRLQAATRLQATFRGARLRVVLAARAMAASAVAAGLFLHTGCARHGAGCASRARVRHAYRAQRAAASHAVLRAVPDAPLYRCNRRHAAHERTPLAACRHGGAAYGARQSRARIRRRLRYLAHLAAISKLHAAAKLVQYVTRRRQALAGGDQAGRSGTGKRQAVRRMRLMRWMIRRIQARMRGRRTRSRVYKRMPRLAEIASHAEKARLRAN